MACHSLNLYFAEYPRICYPRKLSITNDLKIVESNATMLWLSPPDINFFLFCSCHVKGLSTFIVNLFRTGLTMTKPNKWMEQYGHGLCQEVFPVILPDCFHQEGFLFEQVRGYTSSTISINSDLFLS